MDKARRLVKRKQSYDAIRGDGSVHTGEEEASRRISLAGDELPYTKIEYTVFLLLGVAMLWAWNMFLAAAPYFQRRFRASQSLLSNFQAAEVSISTIANLGSMLVLTKLQAGAKYTRRINMSLIVNAFVFALLAVSTKLFTSVSAVGYFVFTMIMVLASSTATGFMQNGAFAYAAGMGRPEYIQGIMTGQAVAGVLPPLVQIASVLTVDDAENEQQSSTSALTYFATATLVAALTLVSFLLLLRRHAAVSRHQRSEAAADALTANIDADSTVDDTNPYNSSSSASAKRTPQDPTNTVPIHRLWSRLSHISSAVFLTFAITMVFPVFTQEILSVQPPTAAPIFRPAAFIPLAFLFWNTGDLLGRLIPLWPSLSLAHRPRTLLILSIFRAAFIPLYMLCNIQSGYTSDPSFDIVVSATKTVATISSDAFYLLVVQLPFGLTNGYLGSCCMMGAGACVEDDEREAAGSFMGLMLVAGLAVGSLCSFFVGYI